MMVQITRTTLLLSAFITSACVSPKSLSTRLDDVRSEVEASRSAYAAYCSPEAFAKADANMAFAELELRQGDPRRAQQHLDDAALATRDSRVGLGTCGLKDSDGDGIPDVTDQCPAQPEDKDGDADEDGCRDVVAGADDDGDGILNNDDACISVPEDLDGDADEDGCPESSEDTDGDSIVDAADRCPTEAEDFDQWEDEDGCPEPDNDRDGIEDQYDGCTTIEEDFDGWDDHDGCPDPDNDADGIPDSADACPNEAGERAREGCPLADADADGIADKNDRCPKQAETRNQYLDEDGCPDDAPASVQVDRNAIKLLEPIMFGSGSTSISKGGAIIKSIAQVLKDAPDLVILIEGHTDSQGDPDTNKRLSERRAAAVKKSLVRLGIDADRIDALGMGSDRPIAPNRTPEGRKKNRRIEVLVVSGYPAADSPD